MQRTISPGRRASGTIRLPGDKSISHRYAMLTSIAEGVSEISNYSTGADCASTIECMQNLGVKIEREGTRVVVHGVGLDGLHAPTEQLDAGNSGSTIRMLAGILAGQGFTSSIGGDESLSKRPMKRIMTPLEQMGGRITGTNGEFPPLTIEGSKLAAIHYEPPMASAQVKTAVLFGGIYADGVTSVREKSQTRNHSELALQSLGAEIEYGGSTIRLKGRPKLTGCQLTVPSDLSSAAFFIAVALMLPGSELRIEGVGLNPTRTDLLDVLLEMEADIEILPHPSPDSEPMGTLIVRGPKSASSPVVRGGLIEKTLTAGVIDEIPILAVLGAASLDGLEIRDAGELRVKETDRIRTIAANLAKMGIKVEAFEDGLRVPGRQRFEAAELDSFGDHRIAMAFAVAALKASGPCVLHNAEAADVSFPEFYNLLATVVS
ncbi:MAG: 3-phosphoshikimate 1-carboxyvinyltransferase [Acidobacteria bacterium]|nr:3-phosphoshikimate 1-carboxyvinyltransferase [Acidobacteriota bacterium]MDA1235102.1 3-phosphoshikimate 1-carboxyvinyltransferase [Acidobacteriota bacterium]